MNGIVAIFTVFFFLIFAFVIIVVFATFGRLIIGKVRSRQNLRSRRQPRLTESLWRVRAMALFSQVARQYGGRAEPGEEGEAPRAIFKYANAWVLIDIHTTFIGAIEEHYTQIHFHFEEQQNIRCEIYPEDSGARLKKLLGMQDIQVGSPKFDDMYIVQGDDPNSVRELLQPPVRQQIERLRRETSVKDIYVALNRRRLLVKKRIFFKYVAQFRRFVQLALGLYDLALSPEVEGVEFVESSTMPDLADAVCQICGEQLETDIVRCSRCHTPHHGECWKYYGACSTYGCLGEEFVR